MDDDLFFLRPLEAAQATRLYGLRPVGLATGLTESLHSYLLALAHAHRLPLRTLLPHVFPQLAATLGQYNVLFTRRGSNLVGVLDVAADWCQALGKATGVMSLELATMLPLRHLVCSAGLISSDARFCVQCCREDIADRGQSYGRLLWRLTQVTCCPLHRSRLQNGYCCEGQTRAHNPSTVALFGVCGDCRSIGYQCMSKLPEPAMPEEVGVARDCLDILNAAAELRQVSLKEVKLRFGEHVALHGGYKRFAQSAHEPPSQISRWLKNEEVRLSLRAMVNMSAALGIRPVDFMKGQFSDANPSMRRSVTRDRQPRRSPGAESLKKQMESALGSKSSPAALARRIGVDPKTMKAAGPEVFLRLQQEYRDAAEEAKVIAYRLAISRALDALRMIEKEGWTPCIISAARITGQQWMPWSKEAVALLILRSVLYPEIAMVGIPQHFPTDFYAEVQAVAAELSVRRQRKISSEAAADCLVYVAGDG